MKKRKMIMFISILFMAIGFASVSAVLYLNGQIGIVGNTGDFDVYFSKAIENGVENSSIIKDRNHLEFTTELRVVDEEYVLDYEVTNASKQYDASLLMNCTGGNDFLRVSNEFDIEEILPARTTRKGTLTLRVIKTPLEEMSAEITCEITGNAVERDTLNMDEITGETGGTLIEAGFDENTFFGHALDRTKVETITFIENVIVPENAIDSWDASDSQDGSIMVYTLDTNKNNLYELYIGKKKAPFIASSNSSYMFYAFENLVSIINLEKLDTSNVTNMSHMFEKCTKLKDVNVSQFNTENVTDMSRMFNMITGNSSLTNLDVSGFNTSNVTTMEYMFYRCQRLTSLAINNWNTQNVVNMRGMFHSCSNLSELDLSNWNTEKVTDMSYLFHGCSGLKAETLVLTNLNTSQVTTMQSMFFSCQGLTSLDVSHFDTSKVTNMGSIFSNCRKLSTLNLSAWDTSQVTFLGSAFSYCDNLTNLDISTWNLENVTNMNSMFASSPKIKTKFTVRGTKCTSYSNMFASAATATGASITVNYTASASTLVSKMISGAVSNVKKGVQVV